MNPETSPPDAALLALRPAVPTEAAEPGTAGHFLHTTLRPVLKLQNDRILAVVADFVRDHHIALLPTDRQHQLNELLARNTRLRYTVIGLVTGMLTTPEYGFYRQHRAELNRRLLELAVQRVLDQAGRVVELASPAVPQ